MGFSACYGAPLLSNLLIVFHWKDYLVKSFICRYFAGSWHLVCDSLQPVWTKLRFDVPSPKLDYDHILDVELGQRLRLLAAESFPGRQAVGFPPIRHLRRFLDIVHFGRSWCPLAWCRSVISSNFFIYPSGSLPQSKHRPIIYSVVFTS